MREPLDAVRDGAPTNDLRDVAAKNREYFKLNRAEREAAAAAEVDAAAKQRVKPYITGIQPETGALRESIGTKIDTTLVPYELICAAAVGLNYGATKYAPRNFEKGLSARNLLMSIERHTRAMMDGEQFDEASGLPHECLLASSVAMLVATSHRGTIVKDAEMPVLRAGDLASVSEAYQRTLDGVRQPNLEGNENG